MSKQQQHEEALWQIAEKVGMSRRWFLHLLSVGGASAVMTTIRLSSKSLFGLPLVYAAGPEENFAKPTKPYHVYPFAVEAGTRWWDVKTYITPWERVFIRNRYKTPLVDKAKWTLKISGDAVEKPLTLTYDELLKLPSRSEIRVHECFGNGRTLNWEQLGHEVRGGNWGFSDVGQVEWAYVPMAEILDRAKVKADAKNLLFWSGVDGPDTGRPMPMSEIFSRLEEIGLAFGMNGVDLPPDHGGPVRAVVPGWGGAASVKWLTEIIISSTKGFWTRMHTKEEAYIGPDYPPEKPGPDDEFRGVTAQDIRGQMGTWLKVKSHLTIPYTMKKSEPPEGYPLKQGDVYTMPAGKHMMLGYAYSPNGIQKVEYSLDGGKTWTEAPIKDPLGLKYRWVRFEFPWEATRGTHILATRATDKQGEVQPDAVPFNELGINCNAVPKFEVNVTS